MAGFSVWKWSYGEKIFFCLFSKAMNDDDNRINNDEQTMKREKKINEQLSSKLLHMCAWTGVIWYD